MGPGAFNWSISLSDIKKPDEERKKRAEEEKGKQDDAKEEETEASRRRREGGGDRDEDPAGQGTRTEAVGKAEYAADDREAHSCTRRAVATGDWERAVACNQAIAEARASPFGFVKTQQASNFCLGPKPETAKKTQGADVGKEEACGAEGKGDGEEKTPFLDSFYAMMKEGKLLGVGWCLAHWFASLVLTLRRVFNKTHFHTADLNMQLTASSRCRVSLVPVRF